MASGTSATGTLSDAQRKSLIVRGQAINIGQEGGRWLSLNPAGLIFAQHHHRQGKAHTFTIEEPQQSPPGLSGSAAAQNPLLYQEARQLGGQHPSLLAQKNVINTY